ncbi:MAG TPA: DUF4295 domain-containing protein [Bacteroidales bacterium]|nr:DUF4295 domain-containing protein [Bacteroidales bacterium]
MAKKAVATFGGSRQQNKNYVKCIRMVKSERTGAYAFQEELLPTDQAKDFFEKK